MSKITKLKKAIEAKGISQKFIAKKLGIDPYYLNKVVNGHHKPSADYLSNLLKLLK